MEWRPCIARTLAAVSKYPLLPAASSRTTASHRQIDRFEISIQLILKHLTPQLHYSIKPTVYSPSSGPLKKKMSFPNPTFLIWGANGWIATHLKALLHQQHQNVKTTAVRMQEQTAVRQVLDNVNPTHVINCAGKTGRPNIDWCEDHKMETVESNVLGTLILAEECRARGVHCTVLATGCESASFHLHTQHP